MSSCQDWLACAARCASVLLAANFRNASDPPASCQNWLRPGAEVVKNAVAEFTSIVDLLRLECVTPRLYKIGRLNCSGTARGKWPQLQETTPASAESMRASLLSQRLLSQSLLLQREISSCAATESTAAICFRP